MVRRRVDVELRSVFTELAAVQCTAVMTGGRSKSQIYWLLLDFRSLVLRLELEVIFSQSSKVH